MSSKKVNSDIGNIMAPSVCMNVLCWVRPPLSWKILNVVDSSIIKEGGHTHILRPNDHSARLLHIIPWYIIIMVLKLAFHFLLINRILSQGLFFILFCTCQCFLFIRSCYIWVLSFSWKTSWFCNLGMNPPFEIYKYWAVQHLPWNIQTMNLGMNPPFEVYKLGCSASAVKHPDQWT